MIKKWTEMYNADITEYIMENKEQKDKNGNFLKYIPWNLCIKGLHDNGAERVRFMPVFNDENGHSVFVFQHGAMIEKDQNGKRAKDPYCPEVHVRVVVDDMEDEFSYPLINGLEVITMGKINQQLVNSARQRAFVKGAAIMTGFGLSLWEKEESEITSYDDLYSHSIFSIKKRIEEAVSATIKKGISQKDMLSTLGINQKQFDSIMKYPEQIAAFEKKLKTL